MTETLASLLTRLSEGDGPALLWGREARPFFGPLFDRLVSRGVLVENAPDSTWHLCADCECGLDARPIEVISGRNVAVCPLDRGADRVLEPDDIRSFTIDREALVREISRDSGLGEPSPIGIGGVWILEETEAERLLAIALSRKSAVQELVSLALQRLAHGRPVTFVAPRLSAPDVLRLQAAGVHLVELSSVFVVGTDKPFGLDPLALDPLPDGPVLVVRRASFSVEFDGHRAELGVQTMNLMVALAERALTDKPILTHHEVSDLTNRVPRDIIRDLRDGLTGSGLSEAQAKEIVRSVSSRGYRIGLPKAALRLLP